MELIYIATFFVALLSSIFSGIAGSGGGFIMAPYWLLTGMTPAQAAASGSSTALAMSSSSVLAFRGSGHMPSDKKLTGILLIITLAASAVGPFFLQHIDASAYKPIMAVLTIISLPLLFINRKDIHLGKHDQTAGIILLGALLLASSFITSSAFSIFIAVVLAQLFNFSVLQSTALRKLIAIVQSVILFGVLVALGNFVWPHALAGAAGGSIGSYIGTKIAIKRGESFAKYALAIGAIVSSIALLV